MKKINNNILVVGTYPILHPRHGGQKRLSAIVQEYKKSFLNVKYVSVFFDGFYSKYSSDDIALGKHGQQLVYQSPLTGDIICGEAIFYDPEVKNKFTKLLQKYAPDIIHIEQPYPYLGLKLLLDELGLNVKLIFGSQNIEGPMKAEILEGYGTPQDVIDGAVEKINRIEIELSQDADLVVACTKADLAGHKAMGARHLVLAANGVELPDIKTRDIRYWHEEFMKQDIIQTAVFIGSAHPPNWAGFTSMVSKNLGFVKNNQRIVIAGSISDYAEREIKGDTFDIGDATFWLRAYSAGRLSEERLVGLIAESDVILLPITEGGGSNLKTAEAIIADKKVVTTSHALRSFEWFKDYPNVWVADTQKDFQAAIMQAFDAKKIKRTPEETEKARTVLWEHCLHQLIEETVKL